MARISKHISIYLSQFFSIASIIGRVTITLAIFLLPVISLFDFYKSKFFLKWILIFIFIYHVFHFLKKVFFSENGILGFYMLMLFIPILISGNIIFDAGFFILFFMLLAYHSILGLSSLFADYSFSKKNQINFITPHFFFFLKSTLLFFFFIGVFF